jgi:hypothetical protein
VVVSSSDIDAGTKVSWDISRSVDIRTPHSNDSVRSQRHRGLSQAIDLEATGYITGGIALTVQILAPADD